MKPIRIRSKLIAAAGGLIILASLSLEIVGSPGLGPYQIVLILFGALLFGTASADPNSLTGKVLLVLLSISFTLIAVEVVLRGYVALRPADSAVSSRSIYVGDPVLIHRVLPNNEGFDALGWRNAAALEQADIVILGDSQTYGINAAVDVTWPALLQKRVERPVYMMALGGYGPLDYYGLLGEALEFHPQHLIIALYFGNDLLDSLSRAYTRDAFFDWRSPDDAASRIDYLDTITSLYAASLNPTHAAAEPLLNRFLNRTVIGRLVLEAMRRPAPPPPVTSPLPVTLNIRFRLMVLDDQDTMVDEGVMLSLRALDEIRRVTQEEGIALHVLLIPTKESAYTSLLDVTSQPGYADLVRSEAARREQVMGWLQENGIEALDMLPLLQAGLARGEVLYPVSADGHPLPAGYDLIAEAVYQAWFAAR